MSRAPHDNLRDTKAKTRHSETVQGLLASGQALDLNPVSGPMRLAKRLARCGVASRRDAETMILAGRVCVNGQLITTCAQNVTLADKISLDGKPLANPPSTRLWLYHKPRGLVTTHKDPQGRKTLFASLPKALGHVISVGRLDYASEGLILLTNDGGLAHRLEMPSEGFVRVYRVRVRGCLDEAALLSLTKGATVDGVTYRPIEAEVASVKRSGSAGEKPQGQGEKQTRPTGRQNHWLTVRLYEGKNREVRKVLASIGLEVTRLIRTRFGPFDLGALASGALREVPLGTKSGKGAGETPKRASPPARSKKWRHGHERRRSAAKGRAQRSGR